MRRLKTVRRPPIYPKSPGHLPCSSLTHPLPLPSRRPSVSFGGFGFKHLVATLVTALAVSVLAVGCANSNDDESTSPAVTQDVVTFQAAESELVKEDVSGAKDQGVFLRVIAPLDEARGYCLDIPGHMAGVQIESPLHVHTCKHGIWNQDGRFDGVALRNGVLAQIHRRDDYAAAERAIVAREGDGPGTIWGRGGPVSVFSCRGETL